MLAVAVGSLKISDNCYYCKCMSDFYIASTSHVNTMTSFSWTMDMLCGLQNLTCDDTGHHAKLSDLVTEPDMDSSEVGFLYYHYAQKRS